MKTYKIGSVTIEIDDSFVFQRETLRVGDTVKILMPKGTYGEDAKKFVIKYGVIVSFDNFDTLPTIVICYVEGSYKETVEFLYLNERTENISIIRTDPQDLSIEQTSIIDYLDNEIAKKQSEKEDMLRKKQYFLTHFGKYFKDVAPTSDAVSTQ